MSRKIKILFTLQMILTTVALTISELNGPECLEFFLWSFATELYVLRFSMLIYEDSKLIYPQNIVCQPMLFRKAINWLYKKKELPKCIINEVYILIALAIIYSVVFTTLGIKNISGCGEMFLAIFAIGIALIIYVYYGIYFAIFLERFKRVNKYNIKYLIGVTYKKTYKWPVSKILGKCNIVHIVKKGKKQYAKVVMQENGTIYENVLVINELRTGKKQFFKLHEICCIKYII